MAAATRDLGDPATWGGKERAARAFRRWREAGNARAVLNVTFCGLRELPAELFQLTDLTRLDCSENLLTALPAELGQLTALTAFDCSWNQLAALPAELGQLAALTELWCSNNQLAALPPELGQLAALQELDKWGRSALWRVTCRGLLRAVCSGRVGSGVVQATRAAGHVH